MKLDFIDISEILLFSFPVSNIGADGILDFPKAHLLELIIKRKNLISVNAAVKFIKLAFMYEEWSLFESAAGQLIDFLQVIHAKQLLCFYGINMMLKC